MSALFKIPCFRLFHSGFCILTNNLFFCNFAYRFVGVGEASFISLAAPYIDDSAPVARVSFQFCCY